MEIFNDAYLRKYFGKVEKLPQIVFCSSYKCIFCRTEPLYLADSECEKDGIVGHDLSIAIGIKMLIEIYLLKKEGCPYDELKEKCLDRTQNIYNLLKSDHVPNIYRSAIDDWLDNQKENGYVTSERLFEFYYRQHLVYEDTSSNKRYITTISVENLFGYNSFSLNLNTKTNLSVIYGANGLGKTTVFKMIEAVLFDKDNDYSGISYLLSLPFDYFSFEFSDRTKIELNKSEGKIEIKYYSDRFSGKDKELQQIVINGNDEKATIGHYRNVSRLLPDLTFSKKFCFLPLTRTNRITSKEFTFKSTSIYSDLITNLTTLKNLIEETDEQKKILNKIDEGIVRMCKELPSMIKDGEENINTLFKEKINEIKGEESSVYDNIRKTSGKGPVRHETLIKKYKMLENYQKFKNQSELFKEELDELDRWIEGYGPERVFIPSTQNYITNMRLFEALYNDFKISFSHYYDNDNPSRKELTYYKNNLFIYLPNFSKEQYISIKQLSSGEYNILSILFHIIFDTTKNAILLVDEPEVSLHIIWQQILSEDIYELANKRGKQMQVIVASHSFFFGEGHKETIVLPEYFERKQ